MSEIIDIDIINEKIKKKKMSVAKIAEETGYSRVSIYRYLSKKRLPTIDFINKLSKILD